MARFIPARFFQFNFQAVESFCRARQESLSCFLLEFVQATHDLSVSFRVLFSHADKTEDLADGVRSKFSKAIATTCPGAVAFIATPGLDEDVR